MPLTPAGTKVLSKMKSEYGGKKGSSVFYASINSGRLKKRKMEGRSSGNSARSSSRGGGRGK